MIEILRQPWHWVFSGIVISSVMLMLLLFGKSFSVSGSLRTVCSMGGAGKKINFFNFDWKGQIWNLIFVFGAIIGGYIAGSYLMEADSILISEFTLEHFNMQSGAPHKEGVDFLPGNIFNFDVLFSLKGLILFVGGGFLVGFGARYAGGCTSGHAISGLSNLQVPSLIAVIGFFIGGVLMTHFILPIIINKL